MLLLNDYILKVGTETTMSTNCLLAVSCPHTSREETACNLISLSGSKICAYKHIHDGTAVAIIVTILQHMTDNSPDTKL